MPEAPTVPEEKEVDVMEKAVERFTGNFRDRAGVLRGPDLQLVPSCPTCGSSDPELHYDAESLLTIRTCPDSFHI